jgi:hypothetical protein
MLATRDNNVHRKSQRVVVNSQSLNVRAERELFVIPVVNPRYGFTPICAHAARRNLRCLPRRCRCGDGLACGADLAC